MAQTFQLDIVTPDRLLQSTQAEMVTIPGTEGEFGVLANHAALISTLKPGIITIFQNGVANTHLFVSGGLAEINNNRCTILADSAKNVAEINRAEVESQIRQIQQQLDGANETEKTKLQRDLGVYQAMLALAA
jgi:F-type H+-transporting ATPase subunit epsilon